MASSGSKLEFCEVCATTKAKYTCPKCEVRTCSLTCTNIHKKELDCDGIRDKTKFVPLHSFTDLDLLSDYRLLEGIGRSVEQLRKDPSKKFTRQDNLPPHLHKLRRAAQQRGTRLQYMPQNFSRHTKNTTYLNWKTGELFWRIEWIFPDAENAKWVEKRLLDSEKLSTLLERVLNPIDASKEENTDIEEINLKMALRDRLKTYRTAGTSGIKVLLKSEKVEKCRFRFYELDMMLTLRENFTHKTIIEFPTLYVVLCDNIGIYEIIKSDEEEKMKKEENPLRNVQGYNGRKWKEANRQIVKKKDKNDPVNFFFDNDFTDSDDENMDADSIDNSRQPMGSLNIPEYSELIKMES